MPAGKRRSGNVVTHVFESKILKSNPLKDPYIRDIIVYLPPGYSRSSSNGYVTVLGLVGFGRTGRMAFNVDPLTEPLDKRMDRLISAGKCGPMIVVMVDCFTRFGGSQYINSSATGRYEDYIVDEVVPFIEKEYNISSMAVWGKSSGGYGSLVLGMRHPEIFRALADHSGDAAFEYSYLIDFPKALEEFRKAGGPKLWLERFWKHPEDRRGAYHEALSTFAMAAHYSPNPKSKELGVDLPFDLETGELRQDVWKRWLSWDPVRMVEKYKENLRKMKLIYLDVGSKDEFNLQWGARILHTKLGKAGIRHYYEEFEGGHMNIQYRYDKSLPMIYEALSK
ncbi:MAG: esterase [Nitrososphaerota archaeon]|nr:esterase [Nitrososphaerota archaeon]